ncbi:MAG: methylmalonyl Co-A mutase-associated GTPase MeaB [Hyphomicrobiaceae bacterium]
MASLSDIRAGGKRALSAALAEIERDGGRAEIAALLDAAHAAPRGSVIGLTGPPGVGKSTLINALIALWRRGGETVGVVAVDPSSRRSGGALLGDRARMTSDPADQGVYIRSLAARGRLGGLADLAFASVVLMRALFDRVIVESVGVGQSEAEIVSVADTVVLCVQPGSGDTLQFMKAGIMEIPAVAVVTKADLGAAARRAVADLKVALSLVGDSEWEIPVCAVSATTGEGVTELAETIDRHGQWLEMTGHRVRHRQAQASAWVADAVRSATGEEGLRLVSGELARAASGPFRLQQELRSRLRVRLAPD